MQVTDRDYEYDGNTHYYCVTKVVDGTEYI